MAQTPEGQVKSWLYGTTAKPGRIYQIFEGPIWLYKPAGGMFGRTGVPDCVFVWRGVFVGLEVKAEGNTATALQLRNLQQIKAAGGVAAIITGKDEARLQLIYRTVLDKVKRHESDTSVL